MLRRWAWRLIAVAPLDLEIDDLIQEGRIALWQSPRLEPALQTVIARRRMLDAIRRSTFGPRGRRLERVEAPDIASGEPGPDDVAEARELIARARRAVGQNQRASAIFDRVLECNATTREVAAEFGVSHPYVVQIVRRVVERMAA